MHWALMELAIGGGGVSPLGLAMVPTCSSASRPLRAASRCRCAAALTPTALVGRGGCPREEGERKGRMLEIHAVMLEVLGMMRPVLEEIGRHDRDLESQARRASSSVVLNVAEGSGARGKNRIARYAIALGEAREAMSFLQVAVVVGYIP